MTEKEKEKRKQAAIEHITERRKLWKQLESKNIDTAVNAAILLGKMYLGQKD